MSTRQASDLDGASRSDLIARAEALGIDKADVLTRAELVDEIVKRTVADPIERRLARGLLGVARDLVARVVERGLHLPDAAALIRGLQHVTLTPVTPPIATVTLAEIYAGQGHRARALTVLDEVLEKEPEHAAARALREKVAALPSNMAPAMPPSEPPPQAAPSRPPEADLAQAHDVAPPSDRHVSASRERDTLPPDADAAPALVPTDLPLAAWPAGPPEHLTHENARPTEMEPMFGAPAADQIVLVPADDTSAVARWELGATTLDEARARAQGGDLILRVVAVTPSWDGPKVEIRDIQVTQPVGDWWVCDLPPASVLRAAIGWRGDRGFDPLAVALDAARPGEGEPITSEATEVEADAVHARAGIEERARRRAQEGRPAEGRALSSWRTLALAPWDAPYEEVRPATVETR